MHFIWKLRKRQTTMTRHGWLIGLLGLLATTSGAALACENAPSSDTALRDRSWIHSTAAVYGAEYQGGVFRLQIAQATPEPIGSHGASSIYDFRISDDKRWLIYSLGSAGRDGVWLYDTVEHRETGLTQGPVWQHGDFVFSPDGKSLAWMENTPTSDTVMVQNLPSGQRRVFALPDRSSEQNRTYFGMTWSKTSDRILFGYRSQQSGDQFWALSNVSGVITEISAWRSGNPKYGDSILHYEDGAGEIGSDCILCGRPQAINRIELANDVVARTTSDGMLVIDRNGQQAEMIATSPPRPRPVVTKNDDGTATMTVLGCTSPRVALLGAFDGRYIVYKSDNGDRAYWIYGIDEKRKAILFDAPGGRLTW